MVYNVKDLPLPTHFKTNEIIFYLKLKEDRACSIPLELVQIEVFKAICAIENTSYDTA